jgi:hypothetical protein
VANLFNPEDSVWDCGKLDLVFRQYFLWVWNYCGSDIMKSLLETNIYYNTVTKKWEALYKTNPKEEFGTIVDLLTFLGKKCLVLQNDAEFQFKAGNEELQRLFS